MTKPKKKALPARAPRGKPATTFTLTPEVLTALRERAEAGHTPISQIADAALRRGLGLNALVALPGGCVCHQIIGRDETRHFKECPRRADFPVASTEPCGACGGSGRATANPTKRVPGVMTHLRTETDTACGLHIDGDIENVTTELDLVDCPRCLEELGVPPGPSALEVAAARATGAAPLPSKALPFRRTPVRDDGHLGISTASAGATALELQMQAHAQEEPEVADSKVVYDEDVPEVDYNQAPKRGRR
jgi:hypothetical protein